MKHRADAYCPVCGGHCQDPATQAAQVFKPLSLGPAYTGAGQTSFKPVRHGKRAPGQ